MERAAIPELATSMLRFYSAREAFILADRYASEAISLGDSTLHWRWASVAVLIGDVVQADERYKAAFLISKVDPGFGERSER